MTSWLFIGINVLLNLVFIHGAFGWAGLGFIGSPIATATSRGLQVSALPPLPPLPPPPPPSLLPRA